MNVCSYCFGVAGCHKWCIALLVLLEIGVAAYSGLNRDEIESMYFYLHPEEIDE